MKLPEAISIEDYLEGELISEIKHEYVAGAVYAMAGAKNRHNILGSNCLGALFVGLRGKPCRPFNSDTKVRIDLPDGTRFYYPDVSVICEGNDDDESFQERPVVLIEVLSKSTRRIDLGEKCQTYLTLPSLKVLLFVEMDFPAVRCYRRKSDGAFSQELSEGLDAVINLPEIGTALALTDIYEDVSFASD